MIIFDFDQTLVDTSPVEHLRSARRWADVMRRAPSLEIYAGIPELLSELEAMGETVAIVTKSPSMVAKSFIERHRWPIEILVGYHDVRRVKPDPEGLLIAMERAGARPEETLHVGDQPQDTEAARGAGVTAIGSAWGIADMTALRSSRPDEIFETVADFWRYLARR
jgi:HAD superfamily hydrolase (TIGR01549 family)